MLRKILGPGLLLHTPIRAVGADRPLTKGAGALLRRSICKTLLRKVPGPGMLPHTPIRWHLPAAQDKSQRFCCAKFWAPACHFHTPIRGHLSAAQDKSQRFCCAKFWAPACLSHTPIRAVGADRPLLGGCFSPPLHSKVVGSRYIRITGIANLQGRRSIAGGEVGEGFAEVFVGFAGLVVAGLGHGDLEGHQLVAGRVAGQAAPLEAQGASTL